MVTTVDAIDLRSRRPAPEVVHAITMALGTEAKFRAQPITTDRWQFSRTYRPRWMTVAGVVTIPVLGVGLVLLCQRRTEAFTIVLTDRHDGTAVSLGTGALPATTTTIVKAIRALDPPPDAAVLPSTDGNDEDDGDLTVVAARGGLGRRPIPLTVPDGPALDGPPSQPETSPQTRHFDDGPIESTRFYPASTDDAPQGDPPAGDALPPVPSTIAGTVAGEHLDELRRQLALPTWVVDFDSGETLAVAGTVLVGREPRPVLDDDRLLFIESPERSVSRTHFALVLDAGDVWIEDRGSANGTGIIRDGSLIEVIAGDRVRLHTGDRIAFGERRADVTLRTG